MTTYTGHDIVLKAVIPEHNLTQRLVLGLSKGKENQFWIKIRIQKINVEYIPGR